MNSILLKKHVFKHFVSLSYSIDLNYKYCGCQRLRGLIGLLPLIFKQKMGIQKKRYALFVCLFFGGNLYKNKMDNNIIKSWRLTLIFKLNSKI